MGRIYETMYYLFDSPLVRSVSIVEIIEIYYL